MTVRKSEDEDKQESGSIKPGAPLTAFSRIGRFSWDIGGVFMLALALMTVLTLGFPGWTRGLLRIWGDKLWIWLGYGSLYVPIGFGVAGLLMLRQRGNSELRIDWGRIYILELGALASMALLSVLGGFSLQRADQGLDGGQVGWGLAELLRMLLSPVGLGSQIALMFLLGTFLFFCVFVGFSLGKPFRNWMERQAIEPVEKAENFLEGTSGVSVAPIAGSDSGSSQVLETKRKRPQIPVEFRKQFRVDEEDEKTDKKPPPRDERLPPLDLLVSEKSAKPDERNINLTAGLIEKTLAEFGIPSKVIGFQVGPTVTQFAVEPGFLEKGSANGEDADNLRKVRVSQISALSRDIALALSAERLRIQAPVPGRPYIGIEVPNTRSSVVRLRPILESDIFYKINSPLTLAFGRDVSGTPVIADLSRMPHMLVAGTTGSGKSVCIAALTTCLVMNNTPEDLRIVMIDPKMVELVRFNGLPHLLGKVETDLERILGVLRWTVAEMDRRYKLLESTRSRNLDSYNRKAKRKKGEEPLPRIVVLIDELADLMMSAPEQTEPALVRLAQMARATGIHLIVATQRPSTDVVTGLIKANFPARISFAVASSIDSRVILDTSGAENLLGKGDMLFLPPEAPAPIRSQGVIVTDQEVEKVITYWQNTLGVTDDEEEEPPWDELLKQEAILADRDDLIQQAIEIVQDTQRASASMLQRRLRIGYPRAARLIDELEELGLVGPSQGGGKERDVLVGPDDEPLA